MPPPRALIKVDHKQDSLDFDETSAHSRLAAPGCGGWQAWVLRHGEQPPAIRVLAPPGGLVSCSVSPKRAQAGQDKVNSLPGIFKATYLTYEGRRGAAL